MTMLTDDHSYRRHLEEALQERFPTCLVESNVYATLNGKFQLMIDAAVIVTPMLRRGQKSDPVMRYKKSFVGVSRKEFVDRMLAGLLMIEDVTNDA